MGEIVGRPPLLASTRFHLQPIDQIDDVEKEPACSVADQGTANRDGQMVLPGSGAADNIRGLQGCGGAGSQRRASMLRLTEAEQTP